MKSLKVFVLILMTALAVEHVASYKILCVYPTLSRSHFIVAEYLMKGLAAKGHNVTVINQDPLEKQLPNYREVLVRPNKYHKEMMKSMASTSGSLFQMFSAMSSTVRFMVDGVEDLLFDPQVVKIMAEETFDIVIVESMMGNCLAGLAAHFKCPLIFFSSLRTPYEVLDMAGAPKAVSYVPYYMADYSEVVTFVDRLKNMMFSALDYYAINIIWGKNHREIYGRNFLQPKYPSYEDVIANASLYLVSHHFSQGDVRPLTPNIIEVSGLQIQDAPTPLSNGLQKWMDNSNDGVIFFSMGSNIKSDDIPKETTDAIVKSFAKLKENVLWKFDKADIPNLPKNVRIENWLSQIDVLQHPKLKLFITHGGLGSVTEAKIYGVPLLVIPFFADQMGNAKTVVDEGWGVELAYANLTESLLSNSIAELLSIPKYRDQAKYSALLFRDRPLTPMQTAIFWVEYVIRHKGAPHMRSKANDLNFFQLHSIDVLGFVAVVALCLVGLIFLIVKCLVKKCLNVLNRKRKIE